MQAPQQVAMGRMNNFLFLLLNFYHFILAILNSSVLCSKSLILLGCSSSSENFIHQEKVLGNTFCKSSYQFEGFYEDYEEQDVSIWIDLEVEGMHLPYAHINIVQQRILQNRLLQHLFLSYYICQFHSKYQIQSFKIPFKILNNKIIEYETNIFFYLIMIVNHSENPVSNLLYLSSLFQIVWRRKNMMVTLCMNQSMRIFHKIPPKSR